MAYSGRGPVKASYNHKNVRRERISDGLPVHQEDADHYSKAGTVALMMPVTVVKFRLWSIFSHATMPHARCSFEDLAVATEAAVERVSFWRACI